MKMFFQRQLHIYMANLFNDVNKNHQVHHSDGSRTVESTGQVVRMLLDGCRGFYHFVYLRKPADADYGALLLARNKLLAGYDAVEAELAPTTHYMTSHFIDFAEADGTCKLSPNVRKPGCALQALTDRGGPIYRSYTPFLRTQSRPTYL